MRALVVALGAAGRRHLANLRRILPDANLTAWRSQRGSGLPPGAEADHVVFDLDEALAGTPDVAIVAGPATQHIAVATALAQRGVHLLIEKPLSHDLQGLDQLRTLCDARRLTLMVGYNLRFYRPLQLMHEAIAAGSIGRPVMLRAEVGQYLPDWRPGTDYRQGVTARADLGGGAVLELSHELDYACWLLGDVEQVQASVGRLGDLQIDVEDTAEIVLRFQSGAIGSVHLDLLQRVATRRCRVAGTEGTIEWDGMTNEVRVHTAAAGAWSEVHPACSIDRGAMYVAELQHFLDCVRDGRPPVVGFAEGRRALALALAAKRSSREGCGVTV